jgi:hypothetical protein
LCVVCSVLSVGHDFDWPIESRVIEFLPVNACSNCRVIAKTRATL